MLYWTICIRQCTILFSNLLINRLQRAKFQLHGISWVTHENFWLVLSHGHINPTECNTSPSLIISCFHLCIVAIHLNVYSYDLDNAIKWRLSNLLIHHYMWSYPVRMLSYDLDQGSTIDHPYCFGNKVKIWNFICKVLSAMFTDYIFQHTGLPDVVSCWTNFNIVIHFT